MASSSTDAAKYLPTEVNAYLEKHASLKEFFVQTAGLEESEISDRALALAEKPKFLGVSEQGGCFVMVRGMRLQCGRGTLSLSLEQVHAVNDVIRGVYVDDYKEFDKLVSFLPNETRTQVVELLIQTAINTLGLRDTPSEFFGPSCSSGPTAQLVGFPLIFEPTSGECVLFAVYPAKPESLAALDELKNKLVKGKLCTTMPADKTKLVFAGTNSVSTVADAAKDEKFLVLGVSDSGKANVKAYSQVLAYFNHSELANRIGESLALKCATKFPINYAPYIISDQHVVLISDPVSETLPFWFN